MNSPRNCGGLTWTELMVALVIFGVLVWILGKPVIHRGGLVHGEMTQYLSNMRQLQMATQQMAVDSVAEGKTNIGWPGDMGGSYSNWVGQLVAGGYLRADDLCKLLSGKGRKVKQLPTTNGSGVVLVYGVKGGAAGEAVFLSSGNFTNTPEGGVLNAQVPPLKNKGYVVMRKAGDGAVLQARQVGAAYTNVIGSYVPLCR